MNDPLYKLMPLAGKGQEQAQQAQQGGNILRPLAGQEGSADVISGNPEWDAYLMELPEEDRPAALQRLMAPLTGEEVWKKRQMNRDYVPNYDEFLKMWEYRKTMDADVIGAIAGGLEMFTNVFGEAIAQTAKNPLEVGKKLAPSLLEALWQGSRDMYGMVAEAEDPDSVLFGLKSILTGNGSDEEKYQQYLQALEFQRKSERLFNGEETLLMDKRLIDEKFTRAAAFVVDPATFVPFGGLVAKGARAAGLGEAMIKAQIRAQAIKTAVYGGAIKIGVGVPLDFIGGAARGTIEKGASIAAKGLDEVVGIPFEDTARMARTVGVGTASAHIAGYSVPYAGGVAAAWAGGGMAESIGQAVKAVSDRYIRTRGERGVWSFAREVMEESKALHPNMQPSKGMMNVLRVMDKIDPFLSYGTEIAEGALGGAVVGGGLGYLSAGGEGFGMGFGTGMGLGASSAAVGRVYTDVSGATRAMREGVQAHFMLEAIKESKPETYKSWNAILAHPSVTPELRKIINRQIVGVHATVDNVNVHALWSVDEFNTRVQQLEAPSAGEAGQQSSVSPMDFMRSDAFTIQRKNNGQVDIFVNMENIFKPSKKYSGLTMAHEFGHALFMHNVAGPHFSAVFRDKMLGVRDASGKLVEGPEIPFSDIKDFLKLYNNIRNVWSRAPIRKKKSSVKDIFETAEFDIKRAKDFIYERTLEDLVIKNGGYTKAEIDNAIKSGANLDFFYKELGLDINNPEHVKRFEELTARVEEFRRKYRPDNETLERNKGLKGEFQEKVIENEDPASREAAVNELIEKYGAERVDRRLESVGIKRTEVDVTYADPDGVEQKRLWDSAIDKLENEKVGEQTKLTPEEMQALQLAVEEFGMYNFGAWMNDKPMEFFLNGGELTGVQGLIDSARNYFADLMESRINPHEPKFRYHKVGKGTEVEFGNYDEKGRRIRTGVLDYFFADMIKAAAQIKNRGYIDLNTASSGYLDTLYNKGLSEVLIKDPKTGKVRVMTQKEFDNNNAQRGAEIFRVLDSLTDEDSAGGMTKDLDGNYSGTFNEPQLRALEVAGLFTPEETSKIRMFQRADAAERGTVPNEFNVQYFGKSMGVSRWDDNQRVKGNRVAFKNRTFILGQTDFRFGADGTYRLNVRVVDSNVIQMRAKEVWLDPSARSLWNDDFQAMLADFYERYLPNLSKPTEDSTRMASADVLGENGAAKRNILHNIAGFAKALDLPYANAPYAAVSRGTMSSVMDLSVGRMVGLRTTGMSYKYDHKNAFWDVSRNYKLDTTQFSKTALPDRPEYKGKEFFRWNNLGIPSWGDNTNNAMFDAVIHEVPSGNKDGKNYKVEVTYEYGGASEKKTGEFGSVQEMQDYLDKVYYDYGVRDGLAKFREQEGKMYAELTRKRFAESRTEPLNEQITKIVEASNVVGSLAEVPEIKNSLQNLGIPSARVYEATPLEEIAKIVQSLPTAQQRKLAALDYLGLGIDANGRIRFTKKPKYEALAAALAGQSHAHIGFVSNLDSGTVVKGQDGRVEARFKTSKDRLNKETSSTPEAFMTTRTGKNGEDVAVATIHANSARAHRHALKMNTSVKGTAPRVPAMMTMFAAQNPKAILQPAKFDFRGDVKPDPFAYRKNVDAALKAGHDVLTIISEKKILDALNNPSFDWQDLLDAIEYVFPRENINKNVIADVGQSLEAVSGKVLADANAGDVTVRSGGAVGFSTGSRLVPKRNAAQMKNAADIGTITTTAEVSPNIRQANTPMFKLDTEYAYITDSIRTELLKPQNRELINFIDQSIIAGTVPTDELWRAYLDVKAAGEAAVLSLAPPLTEAQYNADNAGRMQQYLKEVKQYNLEQRYHYWMSETMEKTAYAFMALERDEISADYISEPVLLSDLDAAELTQHQREYEAYNYAVTEGERQLKSKTSEQLLYITDKLEVTAKDNDWEGRLKQILEDNNVSDPNDLKDISAINGYYQTLGRMEATREGLDTSRIEQIKANLERETNGFLSAEIIIRPNYESNYGTYLSSAKRDIWAGIDSLSPADRDSILRKPFEANPANKVQARVTVVWGPKAIEMRDFVRSYTQQKWSYADRVASRNYLSPTKYRFSVDSENQLVQQRVQNDPAFVERVKEMTDMFKAGKDAYTQARRNHLEKKRVAEEKVANLRDNETYKEYIEKHIESLKAARATAEKQKYIERLGDAGRHRGNDDIGAEAIKIQYLRRKFNEASSEAIEALIAADDIGSLYTHWSKHHSNRAVSGMPSENQSITVAVFDSEGKFLDSGAMQFPPKLAELFEEVQVRAMEEYKSVEYKDTFAPNLPRAVRAVLAVTPNGISARNLIKELEKMHSQGTKVKDEMKYTGFMRWLEEQSKKPKVNGKDPKLDPVETLAFVDSTQLGIKVQKNPKLNIDTYRGGLGSYHAGDGNYDYGIISVHAGNKGYYPSNSNQHVSSDRGRDLSTIAHSRFTLRTGSDGLRHQQIEENQANNRMSEMTRAQDGLAAINSMQSPVIADIIRKAVDKSIENSVDGVESISPKSIRSVLSAMYLENYWDYAGDSSEAWRGVAGEMSPSQIAASIKAAGNILRGNDSDERRKAGVVAWSAAEKFFAKKFLESMTTSLDEVGRVTKDAAGYAKNNFGNWRYGVITNLIMDGTSVLKYGMFDQMSISKTNSVNSKKLQNVDLYHFEFSADGKQAVSRFFEPDGIMTKVGAYGATSWIQGQIASVYTPEVLVKVYDDVYKYVLRAIEQKIDLYKLDSDSMQGLAAKTKEIDKVFVEAMRKHAAKVPNSAVAKGVTETMLRRNAEAQGFDFSGEVLQEMNGLSLSREDIIKMAPVFFTKFLDSGGSPTGNSVTLPNSQIIFPASTVLQGVGSVQWYSETAARTASLGDTNSGLASILGAIALQDKVGTHLKNVVRRIKAEKGQKFVLEVEDDSDGYWANIGDSARKSEWDGNGTIESNGVEYINIGMTMNLIENAKFGFLSTGNLNMSSPFSLLRHIREGVFQKFGEMEDDGNGNTVRREDSQVPFPFAIYTPLESVGSTDFLHKMYTSESDMFKERLNVSSSTPSRTDFLNYNRSLSQFSRFLMTRAASRGERYGLIDNTHRFTTNRTITEDGRIPSIDYMASMRKMHGDNTLLKRIAFEMKNHDLTIQDTGSSVLLDFVKNNIFSEAMDVTALPKAEVVARRAAASEILRVEKDSDIYRRYLRSSTKDTIVSALGLLKEPKGTPPAVIAKKIHDALIETNAEFAITAKTEDSSVASFIATSGLKDDMNMSEFQNLPLAEKISLLQKIAEFPHIDTGEWMKVIAITMFKSAFRNNVDFLTLQHPHEAGAVSGLDPNKAEHIYGNQAAKKYKEVAKILGIKQVERMSGDMDNDNPYYKVLRTEMLEAESFAKQFLQPTKVLAVTKRGENYNHVWAELSPETIRELNELANSDYRGNLPEQVDIDRVQRAFQNLPNQRTGPTTSTPMHLYVAGTDGAERIISLFGEGPLTAVENTIQRHLYQKYYSDPEGASLIDEVSRMASEKVGHIDAVLYRAFIGSNLTDSRGVELAPNQISQRVDKFFEDPNHIAEISKYTRALAMYKALFQTKKALKVASLYATDVLRTAVRESEKFKNEPNLSGKLNAHRNWMMRNRGTTFAIKDSVEAKKALDNPQAMFKLDTSMGEIKIGDWNWRNRPMGTEYKRFIGNKADLQFIHEEHGDKIIGKLRVVPRGNEDSRTEDGMAIEVKAHLDLSIGTAIETYMNPTIDPEWRAAASEELELRMRVLGARRYSKDSEPMPSGTPMAVIGRPKRVADVEASEEGPVPVQEPVASKVDTAPKQVDFQRNNLNNGTMFTSTEGYVIAVVNNKFRLYGANKALVGVYATEAEARRRANALARKGKVK